MRVPARKPDRERALRRENRALRQRVAEAEETLRAIRAGAVDPCAEEARRFLATFVEQNPYPTLRVREDGVLLYANPASRFLLAAWGIQPGKRLPEAVRQELLRPLATGEAAEIEVAYDERILALMCWPSVTDGYVNVYGRDVTQQRRIQERQDGLLADLEAVNAELNEFAYVVSHDLKAPLRAITSLAGWLRRDYAQKLGGEGAAQLALLEGRAKRLNALIDGVLEYSRVGRATEKRTLVDLGELVTEVIDLLTPPASVRIRIVGDLPKVKGARVALLQVFQNLVQNAIKFNDKPEVRVDIQCVAVPGFWEIRVADNGPGIPARHFERVFQMFRTLAPRDRVESTGIGLALVKKIVEVHGGRVWVTSEEGKGSAFHFTVPRDTA
jgi:signal transduction histidine kinase